MEAVSDVISGVAVEHDGLDVRVKFADSRSKRSGDIRAAEFVMDNERRRTDPVAISRTSYIVFA